MILTRARVENSVLPATAADEEGLGVGPGRIVCKEREEAVEVLEL